MTKQQSDLDLGRDKLVSYEDWPPPNHVKNYLDVFAEFIDKNVPTGSVLDIGCGDGSIDILLAERSSKRKIVGTDIEAHPQWKMKLPKNVTFTTSSLYKLPFKPGSFDTVIIKDVLHHVDDPKKVVDLVSKIAKKQVLIIEGNRYNPISYIRMVIIAGHKHFSQKNIRIITGKSAELKSIETHVWPGKLAGIGKISDTIFNKIPALKKLRNYNFVIIRK